MKERLERIFSALGHKNRKNIICIVGIAGILLIFLSSFLKGSDASPKSVTDPSASQYTQELESRLEAMAKDMTGASSVRAMVTISAEEEYVYANEERADSDESGSKDGTEKSQSAKKDSSEKSYVLMNGGSDGEQPLVITKLPPTVKGVILVCKGVEDEVLCEALRDAVTAALDLPASRVYIAFTNS